MKFPKILMSFLVITASVVSSKTPINTNPKLAFNVPAHFGEQHFIVGLPQERIELERKKETVVPAATHGKIRVLFAPDDDLQGEVLKVIEQENECIYVAAFVFSNSKFAHALADATKRGIKVVMIIDPTGFYDRFGKVPFLKEHGVTVHLYNSHYAGQKQSSLLHHKFLIGKRNLNNKSIVVFGSANFSRAAVERNQDNLSFSSDPDIVERFTQQFERMKCERCNVPVGKDSSGMQIASSLSY
jgi:phosphatidylserine/phosphatidylglycerophosphate/cardiolipin synthase-like enzyme